MRKITLLLFTICIVTLGYSQTVLRSYTFDGAGSIDTSGGGEKIETTVPASEFIEIERIANAASNADETTFGYTASGNGGPGALVISGRNDLDPEGGRNYTFRIRDLSIDFQGVTSLEVAFDIRRVGDLGPGTVINTQFFVPQTEGVQTVERNNLEAGLN
jgi:hypothetical protein